MRKKVFLIGFLYCLFLQANAQILTNTIVNDNSSWAILGYGVCPECPVWTQYVYFEGDSIVAGDSYKKVFSCEDKLHENIKYEGLIREQNKKTYFIPAFSEKEYLLYDFSLEEGMTFECHNSLSSQEIQLLEVKNSDLVEINGVFKKRLQLTYFPSSSNNYIIDTWIEDIGSVSGILSPHYLVLDGAIFTLLCYYQNNELIYKNPAYSECYYDKKEDVTSVRTIMIDDCNLFPNPVDNIFEISCLNNATSRIEIFDNGGRQVYSQTGKNTIDVSSFSKGLYLIKMYDTNERVSVFKIIKK
jgi:hypothetical protein